MATEIEYKFNSSFNNQLKYTQDSEPSVKKIWAILDILGIGYGKETTKLTNQTDSYFDSPDHTILNEKNSLRIRKIEGERPEITSKHFISYDANGLHQRKEDNDFVQPDETLINAVLRNGRIYFPEIEIQQKPVVIVKNNRTSFNIKTGISSYVFCLDKFHFINPEDGITSDDLYEIEIEQDSQKEGKQKDPQIEKLSIAFKDIFGFSKTERNKYAKGCDWLKAPISSKDMQFVIFDVVGYSDRNSKEQEVIIKAFTKMLTDALLECSENDCLKIPIGDGVILCLSKKSHMSLEIVQKMFEKLAAYNSNEKEPDLQFYLRAGINYGLVLEYQDINNRLNLAGKGINIASRIITVIEKGQIAISEYYYNYFKELGIISDNLIKSGCFSEPYPLTVKHEEEIPVRNFYNAEKGIGIPHT
jgi:uncharacterized protein YjbK